MPISFDSLPTERKYDCRDAGLYLAEIESAKFNPATGDKKENICVVFKFIDKDGKPDGLPSSKLWDYFYYMSDKELPRYKFARLLIAAGMNMAGATFEPKDIVKVLPGKRMILDVKIGTNNRTGQDQNEIEVFKGDMYYPVSEWAALTGGQEAAASADTPTDNGDDLPFNIDAPDASDAPAAAETQAAPATTEDY